MEEFKEYAQSQAVQKELFEIIKAQADIASTGTTADAANGGWIYEKAQALEKELESQLEAGLISRDEEKVRRLVIAALRDSMRIGDKIDADADDAKTSETDTLDSIKKWFNEREASRQDKMKSTGDHLTNSFEFLEETFGDTQSLSGSQEMVIFLTELSKAYYSLKFVRETGNEAFYKYNKILLLNDRKQELKDLAEKLIL